MISPKKYISEVDMKKEKRAQLLALILFVAVDQAVVTVTGLSVKGLFALAIVLAGIPAFGTGRVPDTGKNCQSQDGPEDNLQNDVFHFTNAPMLCGKDEQRCLFKTDGVRDSIESSFR